MEGKYSLIFMADNGKTARMRLGPAVLRSLVAFLALLPIVAGVSLWLNWELYEDRRSVLAENALLRATVDSNAQTVARLSGLEQFLQQAAPEALGDLVAVSDVPPAPDMETGTEEQPPSTATVTPPAKAPAAQGDSASSTVKRDAGAAPGSETSSSASPAAPTSSSTPSAPSAPAAPATPAATPVASDAPAAAASTTPATGTVAPQNQGQSPAETPSGTTSPTDPTLNAATEVSAEAPASASPETPAEASAAGATDSVDTGFARVENLVARRVGSRSLRISFDLFNAGQVPQLAGHTTFELITKEGQSIALPAHGDTTYRINRLKKIVGNPSLPADIADTSGASVCVSIFADKELIFRVVTPLQQ